MKRSIHCSLLRAAGWALVVLGVLAVALGIWALGALGAHALFYLERFYGPQDPDGHRTYQDLYDYARTLTLSRTRLAQGLFAASGVLGILLGTVTLLWARDRRRLLAIARRAQESEVWSGSP